MYARAPLLLGRTRTLAFPTFLPTRSKPNDRITDSGYAEQEADLATREVRANRSSHCGQLYSCYSNDEY